MKVLDLMRGEVRTVADGTSMTNAIRCLVEAGVSALPVVGQTNGPVGVLTTKDVLRAEAAREPSGARRWLFETTPVQEVMSPWPPAIAPGADVQEAARMMLYLDLQRLFVMEGGRVVGVISQRDIVDAVATGRIVWAGARSGSMMSARRAALEALIDEMLGDSFPASDPPTWDTVAARVKSAQCSDLSSVPTQADSREGDRVKDHAEGERREGAFFETN